MRLAIFHQKARELIKTFPKDVRQELGKAIWDLQQGYYLGMPLSRPMHSVAVGASEIRVRERDGIYRTFYYTKSSKGILIFHAFQKKTQKTLEHEIKLAKKRLMEMLYEEKK